MPFDHERLDVYQLALDFFSRTKSSSSYHVAADISRTNSRALRSPS